MKKVPVYFYYLDVTRATLRPDGSHLLLNDFIAFFSEALEFTVGIDVNLRKRDYPSEEKVIWLSSVDDYGNGNYDLILSSAKYNHRRNVVNTNTMVERGLLKDRFDGDEEKTHVCIRHQNGREQFICIHESNYFGIGLKRISNYINEMLKEYQEYIDGNYVYSLSSQPMPCNEFLEELARMRKISILTVAIERQDLHDDFLRFANRDDIKETVDIVIKKKSRNINIPKDLVSEYYNNSTENENKIQRVIAEGTNETGYFRLDSELMKMKQSIDVESTPDTNEVDSTDFFRKAQVYLNNLR